MTKYAMLFIFLVFTGCASLVYQAEDRESRYGPAAPKQRLLTLEEAGQRQQQNKVSFYRDVKPILDSRCVVCHGCYDAPCQLKLGSIEGADRGASKKKVYDFARLKAADPTRLYIDAPDTSGWRQKSFYPVLNERLDSKDANLENSVLAQLVLLKRQHPQPGSGKLSKDFELEFDRELRPLAGLQGFELGALPEMSLLRVKTGDPEGDPVYTLLIDKAYSNLSKLIREGSRRLPENDRITIVPGFVGSYPIFSSPWKKKG